MYVEMYRNPENGVEIHNYAYGKSGVMMWPRIFRSARNEEDQDDDEDNFSHGTKVLKGLLMTWATTDRIFCADSHSASVSAAEGLWKH